MRLSINRQQDERLRPGRQEHLCRENRKRSLLLRRTLRYRWLRTHLTARVRILRTAIPLAAAVVSLLVGKEQTDAIAALKNKDDGSEEKWEKSLAGHGLNLQLRWAACQTVVS